MTTLSDRTSGWNLRRPWLCHDCHPVWFYGSAVFCGLVLSGLIVALVYGIAAVIR